MYKYQDQKEMREALNGKMITMLVGIMLIFTAVTSTLMMGASFFLILRGMNEGQQEALTQFQEYEKAGGTRQMLQIAGIICCQRAFVEIFAGFFCVRFNNRLDRAKLLFKIVIVLAVAELLCGIPLLLIGVQNIMNLISVMILPAFLLWSVSKLKKLAKNYPDRKFAVEPNRRKKVPAKVQEQPKKSIHDRAAMPTGEEEQKNEEKKNNEEE